MKLTDVEIVKVLECCMKPATQGCHECPINDNGCVAFNNDEEALGVINRQQAEIDGQDVEIMRLKHEIERLQGEVCYFEDSIDTINTEKNEIIDLKDAEIERLTLALESQKSFNICNKETVKEVAKYYSGQKDLIKAEALQQLREKCNEHQDFHKGDDGVFRAYISIEDLDYIVEELGVRN